MLPHSQLCVQISAGGELSPAHSANEGSLQQQSHTHAALSHYTAAPRHLNSCAAAFMSDCHGISQYRVVNFFFFKGKYRSEAKHMHGLLGILTQGGKPGA